jgi:TatD DNase family protein
MKLIDTHCHLYASEFDIDRDAMIRRALEAGVEMMLLPNIDLSSVEAMLQLVSDFPQNCYPMMGLHPCSVKEDFREILQQMRLFIQEGNYYGIGETGIDLYWDTTFRQYQIEAFETQIGWAKEEQLPIIIHSRESLNLNIEIIEHHQDGNLTGIFHCFSGAPEQAKRIFDAGFKIGIGGVLTFKKSGLEGIIPQMPAEMIVLETDSPYLAPVPYRGQRNESAYLRIIAEKLAFVTGTDLTDVAEKTSRNALSVFRKII